MKDVEAINKVLVEEYDLFSSFGIFCCCSTYVKASEILTFKYANLRKCVWCCLRYPAMTSTIWFLRPHFTFQKLRNDI